LIQQLDITLSQLSIFLESYLLMEMFFRHSLLKLAFREFKVSRVTRVTKATRVTKVSKETREIKDYKVTKDF
jgi:hypothetical protein